MLNQRRLTPDARPLLSATLLSPPNLLSLSRFPMAAAFVVFDHQPTRLVLLALASASDMLDGWLARRSGRASTLGALLDPIADKVFVLVALSVFLARGDLGVGGFLLVLSRDIATAVGFLVAWRHPELRPSSFQARWPGKIVTVLQIAVLVALIAVPEALSLLLPLIAAASAVAIVDYTYALHRSRLPT